MFEKSLNIKDINLISLETLPYELSCSVKIRYKQKETKANVIKKELDSATVEFHQKERGIAKEQIAVLYDNDVVIVGGQIY